MLREQFGCEWIGQGFSELTSTQKNITFVLFPNPNVAKGATPSVKSAKEAFYATNCLVNRLTSTTAAAPPVLSPASCCRRSRRCCRPQRPRIRLPFVPRAEGLIDGPCVLARGPAPGARLQQTPSAGSTQLHHKYQHVSTESYKQKPFTVIIFLIVK